jgi:hypothetical protein
LAVSCSKCHTNQISEIALLCRKWVSLTVRIVTGDPRDTTKPSLAPASLSGLLSCWPFVGSLGNLLPPSPPAEKATDFRMKIALNLSVALRMLRLRTIYRAENIGNVLKRVVNVCQREFVNEVLGPLVTEFVCNFGREDARPIQHAFHGDLLDPM